MAIKWGQKFINRIPYGSSLLPSQLISRLIRLPRWRGVGLLLMLAIYGVTDNAVREWCRWMWRSHRAQDDLFWAQMLQDSWVLFNSAGNGYFVDVGAAFPRKYSNSYRLQTAGWRGLLIEPDPEMAAVLRQFRSSSDVKVLQVAVSTHEGSQTFLHAGAMSSLEQTALTDHLGKRRKALSRTRGRSVVQTQTLDRVLNDEGAPRRIGYMSIDTEGADLEVLQSIDLETWDVELITVEHNFNPELRRQIKEFLEDRGYRCTMQRWSSIDLWFIRDSV